MNSKPFYIEGVIEGRNSVFFETASDAILYEKLANTIHSGKKEDLRVLQDKVESINYNPYFENETLKEKRKEKLEGLILNVTESCNFKCDYCIYSGNYKSERLANKSKMKEEIAKKSIDFFVPKAEEPPLISFYGGEPLNNMNLIREVIKYTRKTYPEKKVRFSMTSNFYDADKFIKDIVEGDMNILISLDGPKEIHDKYRRHKNGEKTWDKIMDNVKKFEAAYPNYIKTHVGASVTCADLEVLPQIVKFFKEFNVFGVFRIGGLETKGLKEKKSLKSLTNPIYNLQEEFLNYVIQEKEIPDSYRILFEQQLAIMSQRSRKKMPQKIKLSGACYPSQRKLFVDTRGELYMCEKFGGSASIGDIEKGIDEKKVNKIIDDFTNIRNESCINCWTQRICNPCIQSAKDPEGEISVEGLAQTCKNSKKKILNTLYLYSRILLSKDTYLKSINSLN